MFLILLNIFKNIVVEHGKDSWSFQSSQFFHESVSACISNDDINKIHVVHLPTVQQIFFIFVYHI